MNDGGTMLRPAPISLPAAVSVSAAESIVFYPCPRMHRDDATKVREKVRDTKRQKAPRKTLCSKDDRRSPRIFSVAAKKERLQKRLEKDATKKPLLREKTRAFRLGLAEDINQAKKSGGASGTRTPDLRIMIPSL
jgi:hypothetical protein